LDGKILDQRDLLVAEGANLLAIDGYDPDQLVIFEHRHDDMRARAGQFSRKWLMLFLGCVDRMD
jgi:hypothetical protein